MIKIKKSKISLAFISMCLLIATLSSCREKSSDKFSDQPTTVKIAGNSFTFPRNYSKGENKDILILAMLMPDLQPRTVENEIFLENSSYNKNINIVVTPGNIKNSPNSQFLMKDENKKALNRFLTQATIKYAQPKQLNNGITYYEALSGPEKITINDLYVYHENNDIQFILECPAKRFKSTLGPLCGSTLNIFGNLLLKYWYPIQYLPIAQETHNQIRDLLVNFHNGENKK